MNPRLSLLCSSFRVSPGLESSILNYRIKGSVLITISIINQLLLIKDNAFTYLYRWIFCFSLVSPSGLIPPCASRIITSSPAFGRPRPVRRWLLIRFGFARNNEVEADGALLVGRDSISRGTRRWATWHGRVVTLRNIIVSPDRVHPAIRPGRVHCKQISSSTRGEAD